MKIVKMEDLIGTDREVVCPRGGFTSFRALLAKDSMGFSVHKTIIPAGDVQHWHYKHHLEACFCIEGRGRLQVPSGEHWLIEPDTIYVLDKHDDHTFQAITERVVLISIFNPPITGTEVHRDDGSYESSEEKIDD